jgi:hypothetical protein
MASTVTLIIVASVFAGSYAIQGDLCPGNTHVYLCIEGNVVKVASFALDAIPKLMGRPFSNYWDSTTTAIARTTRAGGPAVLDWSAETSDRIRNIPARWLLARSMPQVLRNSSLGGKVQNSLSAHTAGSQRGTMPAWGWVLVSIGAACLVCFIAGVVMLFCIPRPKGMVKVLCCLCRGPNKEGQKTEMITPAEP